MPSEVAHETAGPPGHRPGGPVAPEGIYYPTWGTEGSQARRPTWVINSRWTTAGGVAAGHLELITQVARQRG